MIAAKVYGLLQPEDNPQDCPAAYWLTFLGIRFPSLKTNNARGNILIEKKLHEAMRILCSRSAAEAKGLRYAQW
jgi:hypothetical protein